MNRPPCFWRSALLLALLAVVVGAGPAATVSIIERDRLLSFDNPDTQALDELTTQSTSHADPLLEIRERLVVAAAACRWLGAGEGRGPRPFASLGCIEARAPPAA
jgi:hypothetical protein